MNALTVQNNSIMQGGSFDPTMINDFIKWIDRGEKTTRSYLVNLRQFVAWLNYAGIQNPTRADIISYRQWLCTEHEAIQLDPAAGWKYRTDRTGQPVKVICKPNTINGYLRSVCQLFKWAAAAGIYPDIAQNIHAPKVSHDTHHKEALSPADVLQIENSIKEQTKNSQQAAALAEKDTAGRIQRTGEQGKRLYALYLLAVNCGLRTIEIHRANVKDLVSKGGQTWLYIWGKGHSEPDQKKPIAPEVAEALKDYLQSRTDKPTGNSPLFVSTGNRSGGKRIASTTISTMLKRAMQAAGYDSEKITAHSLRHTCGTNVMEITGDLYATQTFMRHTSPSTTEIYLHNDTEKQETGIAQQLYNLYHGNAGTDSRATLEQLINRMNAGQIAQLAGIAAAMA
jgi:integrase/recombinase XerC